MSVARRTMGAIVEWLCSRRSPKRALAIMLVSSVLASTGCRAPHSAQPPRIMILHVPVAAMGGSEALQEISGRVQGATPGQQIVLYARSGVWWIQPFANQPFTRIRSDGSWSTNTHLGTEYAALLVEGSYRPAAKLSVLPNAVEGVRANTVQQGRIAPLVTGYLLHFSGYDWAVRSVESDHGGDTYAYDPANAWVDRQGYLHLRMQQRDGRWTCAEVVLTRSLGYGTYRFVVQDSAVLSTTAVLGMFTWDDTSSEQSHREFDIELSSWGETNNAAAHYVVQPFFLPENQYRFKAPSGIVTHLFSWRPGSVAFASYRGTEVLPGESPLGQHTFTARLKTPGHEAIRISLYDFHHTNRSSPKPVEVVIRGFAYLP